MELEKLIRPNIRRLKPYSSARSEFKGAASIFLDANENSFGSPLQDKYNRYPDPLQLELKDKISRIKGVPAQNIFLGNGSDEAIDLVFRVFCEPQVDNVILCPPTYGMYEVCADINDVAVKPVNLLPTFELDVEQILENIDGNNKLLFLCSPNNPTGNSFHSEDIELLIQKFPGVVVIDEAYINYSKQKSAIRFLTEYENLIVLQTFSKAWGLASLRLGMAFASEPIIHYMNNVKHPYNINQATQHLVMGALSNIEWVNQHIRDTITERILLEKELPKLSFVAHLFPSDANFLLVKMKDAATVYQSLVATGIIVRDRSKITLCENCLRITVGTPEENKTLLAALNNIHEKSIVH